VYDHATNRMIVFGGQNGFNTYAGNPQVRVLENADGTGVGTPTWTTLTPTGTPPADRESSALAYDAANNRLIVFGGATVACCAVVTNVYNDVWVLTNANGLGGTPAWTQLSPAGAGPSPRYWTTAEYDAATNRLILFGGLNGQGGPGSDFFNEVWVLANANGLGGTPEWIQVSPTGTAPDGRFGHVSGCNSLTRDLVIATGRNDDTASIYNDVWVLGNATASSEFTGFFSPVDNTPTINSVKAGQGVPVRFSLGGDQGLDIFAPGYPKSQTAACDPGAQVDGVESTRDRGFEQPVLRRGDRHLLLHLEDEQVGRHLPAVGREARRRERAPGDVHPELTRSARATRSRSSQRTHVICGSGPDSVRTAAPPGSSAPRPPGR